MHALFFVPLPDPVIVACLAGVPAGLILAYFGHQLPMNATKEKRTGRDRAWMWVGLCLLIGGSGLLAGAILSPIPGSFGLAGLTLFLLGATFAAAGLLTGEKPDDSSQASARFWQIVRRR